MRDIIFFYLNRRNLMSFKNLIRNEFWETRSHHYIMGLCVYKYGTFCFSSSVNFWECNRKKEIRIGWIWSCGRFVYLWHWHMSRQHHQTYSNIMVVAQFLIFSWILVNTLRINQIHSKVFPIEWVRWWSRPANCNVV